MTIIDKPFTETTTAAVASSSVSPEELAAFVAALATRYAEFMKTLWPTCEANWYTIEHRGGTKYAKIVTVHPKSVGGSAYCFIDLTNGNILKAASWKTPAKHARGNIRVGSAENWWYGALGAYGAAYLR